MPHSSLDLSIQFATRILRPHRILLRRACPPWVKSVLFSDAVLTLRFVGFEEGYRLNQLYRGCHHATNVLTFIYSENGEKPIRSDIVLCCPVIENEALIQRKKLDAHYAHLVLHGVLHAQGYDHKNSMEAKRMEMIETNSLLALGFSDPYDNREI